MNHEVNHGRSVADVLAEMKVELKEFVETRVALLKAELGDKVRAWKAALPLVATGIVLLGTAYLLFTLALVGLVVGLLHNNLFRWCFGFLAVGILWSIIGGIAAYLAIRRIEAQGLVPQKTIGVLKADKIWIQSEVKSQL